MHVIDNLIAGIHRTNEAGFDRSEKMNLLPRGISNRELMQQNGTPMPYPPEGGRRERWPWWENALSKEDHCLKYSSDIRWISPKSHDNTRSTMMRGNFCGRMSRTSSNVSVIVGFRIWLSVMFCRRANDSGFPLRIQTKGVDHAIFAVVHFCIGVRRLNVQIVSIFLKAPECRG